MFAVAFLAQAAVSAVHSVANPGSLLMHIQNTFETDNPMALLPVMIGVRLLVAAAIVAFVFFRASVLAKWVAIFLSLGRLIQARDAWTGLQAGNPNSVAWAIETVLGLIAVACLFLPQARAWFVCKGRTVADDRAVFE